VAPALRAPEPTARLLQLGVGWIAVEHGTPGTIPTAIVDDLDPVVQGGDLELYRLRGDPAHWPGPPRPPVLAAHLIAVVIAAGSAAWLGVTRLARTGPGHPGKVRASLIGREHEE
jgi:hypothetical protein